MRKRILIVEDVEDNRDLLVQFLQDSYDIFEAADGRQGIAMAESLRPDLILMDLSLPLVDGWQATKAIKSEPLTRNIPIVAISAHAMIGDEEKALRAGCNAYLSKPVDFQELAKIVKRFLEAE